MNRCTCGHSVGVHCYTNQIGSCALPGCSCMKYVQQQITKRQDTALEAALKKTIDIEIKIRTKKG